MSVRKTCWISVSLLEGALSKSSALLYIACIDRGSTVRISDVAVLPKADALLELSERVISSFTVQIYSGEEVCFRGSMTWS